MSLNRSSILVVCLAAALVLRAWATQQLTQQQEEQVVEEFESKMSEIDGYQATMVVTTEINNQTTEMRADVWARTSTNEMRQEILAPSDRAGSRVVSNGSMMWMYNAKRDRATRMEVPDTGNANMVPQVSRLVEKYDIYSNGTVDLNGTETHKLTLVPNESAETPLSGTITMWVDSERMFPLKMKMDFAEISSTVRYQNLTLNPEFEPGTFEFEPPEGVEVTEPSMPDISEFDSYERLANATSQTLPADELSEDFTFQSGMAIDSNRSSSVSLEYSNGTTNLSVRVLDKPQGDMPQSGETVSLGDRNGTFVEFGEPMLIWTCNDSRYTLQGPVEKSTLTTIAADIDC